MNIFDYTKTMTHTLAAIAGHTAKLTVREHEIIVREVTMKDLPAFAAACSPFLATFDGAGELAARDGKAPDEFGLFKVLAAHSAAFMQAAALVTNAPVAFYEQLRPDEFFDVAAKVVEVNGSFFIRALMPSLTRLVQGVHMVGMLGAMAQQPKETDGSDPFNALLAQATEAQQTLPSFPTASSSDS